MSLLTKPAQVGIGWRHTAGMTATYSTTACAALLLLAAGCSSAPTPAARFTTHGSMTLSSSGIVNDLTPGSPAEGQPCSGGGGFDDLTAGAQVKIADAAGKTIALGQLDPGKYDATNVTCTFSFAVAGTPAGLDFYAVTVSHRGGPQFTYAQMKAGPSLSITGS